MCMPHSQEVNANLHLLLRENWSGCLEWQKDSVCTDWRGWNFTLVFYLTMERPMSNQKAPDGHLVIHNNKIPKKSGTSTCSKNVELHHTQAQEKWHLRILSVELLFWYHNSLETSPDHRQSLTTFPVFVSELFLLWLDWMTNRNLRRNV